MYGWRCACQALLLCLWWTGRDVAAWDRDTELRLVKDFLDRSAPFGKVGAVSDATVQVSVKLSLMFVLGVDEKAQQVTTSGWMTLSWNDSRLAWNASQYGGINVLFVSQEQVWKPDLFLENTLGAFPLPRSDAADSFVFVNSSGQLTWEAPGVFQSSCQISVVNFPFDSQECFMNFSSFYFDNEEVDIIEDGLVANLRDFVPNNEWDLLSFTVVDLPEGKSPSVVYRLQLKRRSTFHVLKLVVPTILLAIVNCFVMLVPDQSGERRSISLTIMLAWTVFIGFVGEVAPANSDSVPLIAFFVVIHMAISALTSIMTMLPVWEPREDPVHDAFDRNSPYQNNTASSGGYVGVKSSGCCSPSHCRPRLPDYVCFAIIVVLSLANTIWCLVTIRA